MAVAVAIVQVVVVAVTVIVPAEPNSFDAKSKV